jgi:hypothetical protein
MRGLNWRLFPACLGTKPASPGLPTHLAQWDGEFDLFTEITDFRKLAGIIGRLTGRRQASSVFSVDNLPMKAMQRGYERVLFVIGNSDPQRRLAESHG